MSRNFVLLAAGQGVSRLGDGLYAALVGWLAWTVTHDPGAVALVMVAANAPTFLATIVGASYADRFDRRRLMILTDLVRMALVAAVAVLDAAGRLHLPLLVAGAALIALVGAPFAPARNALVPQIVPAERLLQANGLLQVAFRAAFFVGPLLLAPLLAVTSIEVVFAVNALSFLVSAATLAGLRVPRTALPSVQVGLRQDLADGLAVLRRQPDVLLVIGTFVLALVAASGFLTVGVVALVGDGLGGGGGQYGLLLGIAGIAEVAGAMVVARLPLRNLATTAVLAWAVLGLFRFPLGFAGTPEIAAILLALTGFTSALTDIPLIALVQARVPDRHLAKALGLWEAGIAGALAVAPFLAAFTIERLGVRTGFMLSGAALIGLGLAAARLLAGLDRAVRAGEERLDGGADDGLPAERHREVVLK